MDTAPGTCRRQSSPAPHRSARAYPPSSCRENWSRPAASRIRTVPAWQSASRPSHRSRLRRAHGDRRIRARRKRRRHRCAGHSALARCRQPAHSTNETIGNDKRMPAQKAIFLPDVTVLDQRSRHLRLTCPPDSIQIVPESISATAAATTRQIARHPIANLSTASPSAKITHLLCRPRKDRWLTANIR